MNRTFFVWRFCIAYQDRVERSHVYDAALYRVRSILPSCRIALFRTEKGIQFGILVFAPSILVDLYRPLVLRALKQFKVACRLVGV